MISSQTLFPDNDPITYFSLTQKNHGPKIRGFSRLLCNINPVAEFTYACFRIWDFTIQHSPTLFDDFPRCNVVNVTGNAYLLNPHIFGLLKRELKDFVAIPLAPLTWTDVVADVSAYLEQVLIEPLTDTHAPDIFSFIDEPEFRLRYVPFRLILAFRMTPLPLDERLEIRLEVVNRQVAVAAGRVCLRLTLILPHRFDKRILVFRRGLHELHIQKSTIRHLQHVYNAGWYLHSMMHEVAQCFTSSTRRSTRSGKSWSSSIRK